MPIPILPDPSPRTEVLLLHSPYPGRLKFNGMPSSLLHAVSVFAHSLAHADRLEVLGLFDPGSVNNAYRQDLARHLRSPALRVLCISTSTAAIEEAVFAVELARTLRGEELLILVGGPHEDDCDEKAAMRIAGVDLSIGGDAEHVLDFVLRSFLARRDRPDAFIRWLSEALPREPLRGGRVTITSRSSGTLVLDLPRLTPEDLVPPAWSTKRIRFSVFDAPETLPVMVTRGCPYGRCSFCAEPNRESFLLRQDFNWLAELAELRPSAAIYFQDSILPGGSTTETKLLPLLKKTGRPWGCQVYLRTLTRAFLERLAAHGCRYIYTGLETGSPDILAHIGKESLNPELALERLAWIRDLGLEVGISLMFGAMTNDGQLLETEATIDATVALARRIRDAGVPVAGFYPNIMTVLPGTRLARGLQHAGIALDFYRLPHSDLFREFEDGAVGYNFTTIPGLDSETSTTTALAHRILDASRQVQSLGARVW